MSKAIILSRVSTLNQDLQQQTDEVLKFAASDGYSKDNIEIIEDKESAVKLSEEQRLGLLELKQKILENPGMYSCVYAYEISRIGRRSEVNYAIRNFLQQNRVQLVILKPYIKLFDANFKIEETANMTFAIFNALAENEGYIRKERLARGKAKKQSAGGYVGGKIPYGYCIEDKKIVVDENVAKMIRYIFDEFTNKGRSTYSLGKELMQTGDIGATNVNSAVTSIRQILRHPAYIGGKGEYRHNEGDTKRYAANVYPRIISDELFEAAQRRLTANKRSQKTEHKHIYYCKGLIKDARNNRTLVPHYSSANYSCSHVTLTKKQTISIPLNLIDSFIWHLTKEYHKLSGEAKGKKMIKDVKQSAEVNYKKIKHSKTLLSQLEEKEIKTQERIVAGKLKESIGDAMLESIYAQQKHLTDFIAALENEIDTQKKQLKGLLTALKIDISLISSDEEKVKYIKDTIKSIELTKYQTEARKRRHEPTGFFVVTYTTGLQETYYYHTYDKIVWNSDMSIVEFKYIQRLESINKKRYSKSK